MKSVKNLFCSCILKETGPGKEELYMEIYTSVRLHIRNAFPYMRECRAEKMAY